MYNIILEVGLEFYEVVIIRLIRRIGLGVLVGSCYFLFDFVIILLLIDEVMSIIVYEVVLILIWVNL